MVLGRILLIDRMMLAFAAISLALAIIEYEYEYDYKDGDTVNIKRITKMLVLIGLINIMLVCINILRSYLHRQFLVMKRLRDESMAMWSKNDIFMIMLENLMILSGPNIFLVGSKLPMQGLVFGVEVYYMKNDLFNII